MGTRDWEISKGEEFSPLHPAPLPLFNLQCPSGVLSGESQLFTQHSELETRNCFAQCPIAQCPITNTRVLLRMRV